jgi:hypothetical protein
MTSTTIYTPILPTYLYIKKHSVTGLKYFGKTTKSDPYKYKGSGVRWTHHIRKHGKEHIVTLWVSEPYYDTSIIEHALHFSAENNITESNEWANLIPENGLNGGSLKGRTHSAETKAKMSASRTGKKRGPRSAEHKAKLSASNTGKKKGPRSAETKAKMSASNTGRTHSAETKAKLVAFNTGKTRSAETKAKMSASRTGKKRGPYSKKTKEICN